MLVGDGSYLMMPGELVTAVQERLKLTIVLVDNHGFNSIGALSRSRRPRRLRHAVPLRARRRRRCSTATTTRRRTCRSTSPRTPRRSAPRAIASRRSTSCATALERAKSEDGDDGDRRRGRPLRGRPRLRELVGRPRRRGLGAAGGAGRARATTRRRGAPSGGSCDAAARERAVHVGRLGADGRPRRPDPARPDARGGARPRLHRASSSARRATSATDPTAVARGARAVRPRARRRLRAAADRGRGGVPRGPRLPRPRRSRSSPRPVRAGRSCSPPTRTRSGSRVAGRPEARARDVALRGDELRARRRAGASARRERALDARRRPRPSIRTRRPTSRARRRSRRCSRRPTPTLVKIAFDTGHTRRRRRRPGRVRPHGPRPDRAPASEGRRPARARARPLAGADRRGGVGARPLLRVRRRAPSTSPAVLGELDGFDGWAVVEQDRVAVQVDDLDAVRAVEERNLAATRARAGQGQSGADRERAARRRRSRARRRRPRPRGGRPSSPGPGAASPRHAATNARQLRDVRVARTARGSPAGSRRRRRGRQRHAGRDAALPTKQRALVADDLGAHVVTPRARARDVQRRDAAAVEADRDGGVVEVAERLELGEHRRLPRRVHLDRLLAEKPARGVVVVRRHVDAGTRRPGRGSSGSGVRTSRATPTTSERPSDRARGDEPPRPPPARVEAAVVADLHDRSGRARGRSARARRGRPASSRPASRGTGASRPRAPRTPARAWSIERAASTTASTSSAAKQLLVGAGRARRARAAASAARSGRVEATATSSRARRARARSARAPCPSRRARRRRCRDLA